jgi:hypothetical protein
MQLDDIHKHTMHNRALASHVHFKKISELTMQLTHVTHNPFVAAEINLNQFVGLFPETPYGTEQTINFARVISGVLDAIPDPDFVAPLRELGIQEALALSLADLGFGLYGYAGPKQDGGTGIEAYIVYGLTNPACPFARQLDHNIKALIAPALKSYLESADGIRATVSDGDINAITQTQFMRAIGLDNDPTMLYALTWHEGWITPKGIAKLHDIVSSAERLTLRDNALRATQQKVITSASLFIAMHTRMIAERRKLLAEPVATTDAFWGGQHMAHLQALSTLTCTAGRIRTELQRSAKTAQSMLSAGYTTVQ